MSGMKLGAQDVKGIYLGDMQIMGSGFDISGFRNEYRILKDLQNSIIVFNDSSSDKILKINEEYASVASKSVLVLSRMNTGVTFRVKAYNADGKTYAENVAFNYSDTNTTSDADADTTLDYPIPANSNFVFIAIIND